MSCPECEAQRAVYGFTLQVNGVYMTKVPEVKACCPVKVKVTNFDSLKVYFTHNNKAFEMPKKQFMATSWRVYDSY